jgi:GTP-binding protein
MSAFPNVRFLKSANAPDQFVAETGGEVAIAGRSNSGKSSAINLVTQRHGLARTSKTPGQTQLVNFFELEPGRRLVDLPGYGFAKVPREMQDHWGRLLSRYFLERQTLKGLFIVMDVRRPLGDKDIRMMDLVAGRGLPVHLLLTKADKVGRNEALPTLRRVQSAVAGRATAQLFSALSKEGVDEARRALRAMFAGG